MVKNNKRKKSSQRCPAWLRGRMCSGCSLKRHCFVADAPSAEKPELFTQKLQQCCMLFDFLDTVTDLKSKEIKRATLNELVDYVSTNRGVLVEAAYPEITDMVRTHTHKTQIRQTERPRLFDRSLFLLCKRTVT